MGYEYKYKPCGTVKAETLPFSPGRNIEPKGICGPVTIKVPVVLAEKEVQIDVEAIIDIKDKFSEIKRIKKNVQLIQCKLIPNAGEKDCDGKPKSGKLFIKGFVEKNIEYATVDECEYADVKRGSIKDATAKVPFQTVTDVWFETAPEFRFRSRSKEFDYFQREVGCKNDCEETLGKLLCETGYEEDIYFVERPFCELISAKIFDLDQIKEENKYPKKKDEDCYDDKGKDKEEEYCKIIEKMVVLLKVKVLQNQQVEIK
ncbi:CsxC family protein [Alloiococcus sp. CFN-8]|uniref:CsxC family protein n=1 Tax=Alloiococcus sp. CFN-8 TaxID=3416081 RepID=UPI003CEA6AFE